MKEGFGRQRQSKPEFKRFLMLSLESCEETCLWNDYALHLNYITQQDWTAIQQEYDSIIKMIHKLRES